MNTQEIVVLLIIGDMTLHGITLLILGIIHNFSSFNVSALLLNPTPNEIYYQTELNWFGVLFLWILFMIGLNVYTILWYLVYTFYWVFKGVGKLFIIGRK